MTGQAWLTTPLAAVMIAIAGYCASRLAVAYRWRCQTELDADGTHAIMGAAMAGMLVPRLDPGWNAAWVVAFGAAGTWFAWQAVRVRRGAAVGRWQCPHPVAHLIGCAAMLYMFLAVPAQEAAGHEPTATMGTSAAARGYLPVLAVVLALLLFGDVVLTTDRLTPGAPKPAVSSLPATATPPSPIGAHRLGPAARRVLSPRLAACCRIAMAITMGYLLILTL
jgi:hypothetical protein